ncbi:MAG: Trk family potassium uptake protein [Lachnospiraceae bacterium]|nr:Trk family potassium uptake protein [Lachnospiraceae bacterium]
MSVLLNIKDKLTSFQIIILAFASVILLGALILMLPVSSNSGEITQFCDSLFTSVSAVCVTGLVVVDTATHWSLFGQFVILLLIQTGGLGVITVASFLSMLAGRKIGLLQRQTMQNAVSAPQVGGIIKLTRYIFKITFLVEAVGTILLLPVFVPHYGTYGIWMSLFHSVSAFCNAGFDLMGNKTGEFSSFTYYADNGYFCLVISLLIIIGGIGFITWKDVTSMGTSFNKYKMQTKVILLTTAILIFIPTIIFFFTDFSGYSIKKRICLSFFQAITPRTAGFNTADYGRLSDVGQAITMVLMLIGGSPGSTAGGIKTTTIAILSANAIAVFEKKNNANYFGRRIEDTLIKNASTIFFLYTSCAISTAVIMSLFEKLPMDMCAFEAFSAIGTVGLTMGITTRLSTVSHFMLMMLMFLGRVGGLTIVYAAFSHKDKSTLKYPVENIMIG